ncbi:SWI/SNF-related matrix-associated actin-dependent regulator of chromatin subfamily A-like protein 1 [Oppia nitens]|uniref:SWI/SNF-related matrix-associated actin-dependent regulator of chromatin subfamily A-like protein 1 n=1 Tax=Oppia nitens TaxID=1686743 RepID=UPI0023DBAF52|nr:SWI/SNF-related matrix-associated actin-dependent regulator of chromatin subfamily A-like protein 1 [Oppia nitens]
MDNNERSNSRSLDPQIKAMIECKRLEAIERRNKRMAVENNEMISKTNDKTIVNTLTTKPSTSALTNIKMKPIVTSVTNSCNNNKKPVLMSSMKLVSTKRFEIDISYNKQVIEIFRKINSRDWNPTTKLWTFDINDYKNIMNKLQSIDSVDIQFTDAVPERVMTALIEAKNRPKEDIDLNERLGPKLMQRLYEYQIEGILFGIRTGGRCLIADDMGLGKTLQAICIAQWFRRDWPLLIVCPASLRYQWRDSLIEWLPNLDESNVFIVIKEKELSKSMITIISYDLMARMKNQFSIEYNQIYNMVILDESHYIKTDGAVRTESVTQLSKAVNRIILLTGTPALSRPMELFTQIKLINAKLFSSKHEFGIRYCDGKLKQFFQRGKWGKTKQIWDYKGAKNLDELKILLEGTILVRRLKTQVLTQLTKKTREMILLKIDHMTDKEKTKLSNYSKVANISSSKTNNTTLFEWYMDSAIAKLEPVCRYLEQLLTLDIKFLCFCHHKIMMDGIQEMLAQKRINHIRIDGSTSAFDRQEACKQFQEVLKCRVALLSITACATGLNLTSASVVVFAEIFWNPGILSQAEDRIHRIGQQNNVKIYYLVAKNTIDDMVWPMISKKLEVLNKAGLSKDNFDSASTVIDAKEAEQHLITDFFESLDENEMNDFLSDNFKD